MLSIRNILLALGLFVALSIQTSRPYFQPYGPANGDSTLFRNDDEYTEAVVLIGGMEFFGSLRQTLYVDNNGIITLDESSWVYTPESMSILTVATIAPYWSDVDTRSYDGGYVYYRSTLDPVLTSTVSAFIRSANPGSSFTGSRAFVATWLDVGYYYEHTDKVNTFQCVLIADDLGQTYALFNYGDITWTTGDASGGQDGFGGVPAIVGFAKGSDGVYSQLPASMTSSIVDIQSGSNIYINGVAQTGQYLFSVSDGVAISTCCDHSDPPVLSGTPSQLQYLVSNINDVPDFNGVVTASFQCTSPASSTVQPVIFSVYGCPVTRTWTAQDACFKSTSVQQVFTYPEVFTEPLQLSVPSDYTVTVGGTGCNNPVAPDPSVSGTATTNRGADGSVTYSDSVFTSTGSSCTMTRYWIAQDICNTYQYGQQQITFIVSITSQAPPSLTTRPLTTNSVTSSPLTTKPVTSSPLTTQPLTTQALTTQPITSQPLTTQPLTTQPLTSQPLTTQPLTSQELTTQPLTSQEMTTQPLTTQELTTQPLTTKALTTQPLTTSFATVAARCLTYTWPETQGFFCSADNRGYYQCLKGPWASQANYQNCPPGTSCKCAVGAECSAAGVCTYGI